MMRYGIKLLGGIRLRAYLEPIMTAAWFFPFVAALITLPYMVYQYWRYGSIPLLRTVILYSFILYLMCAYFLTMLPLPDRALVASLTSPYHQLEPFKDVVTWIQKSGLVLTDVSTWKKLVINRDLFVILANILMTIPLGIYLRYYFGCSWKKTFCIALGISLVFELTQLSALFGYYPRPYRLCETDDLITNTLGGMIGFWLAKPLMRVLPSKKRLDEVAYRRGAHVSVTRRVTAAIVDWCVLGFLLIVLLIAVRPLQVYLIQNSTVSVWLTVFGLLYVAGVLLNFMLGEWLQRGYTIGKRLTHLRLVDERDGSHPKLWQCVVRYTLLYYGFVPLPFVALMLLFKALSSGTLEWLPLILCIVLMLVYAVCVVLVILRVINRSNQLPHGALSKTRNINTLLITEEMLSSVGQRFNDDLPGQEPPQDRGPMLNL